MSDEKLITREMEKAQWLRSIALDNMSKAYDKVKASFDSLRELKKLPAFLCNSYSGNDRKFVQDYETELDLKARLVDLLRTIKFEAGFLYLARDFISPEELALLCEASLRLMDCESYLMRHSERYGLLVCDRISP